MGNTFNESELARSSECTDQYAQKVFDTADIVRDAMLRQLRSVGLFIPPQYAFRCRVQRFEGRDASQKIVIRLAPKHAPLTKA
jgi:hypothetical protein